MLKGNFNILHYAKMSVSSIIVDDELLFSSENPESFPNDLYHYLNISYPKFFKMDILCKIAFLTSEILLMKENAERFVQRNDRAVVLFNRSSSICTDSLFFDTISEDDFYPKPSLFVYTLPNIATGEIAIRNNYQGESSMFLLKERDDTVISQTLERSFLDKDTKSIIAGWLDAESLTNYESEFYIIEK